MNRSDRRTFIKTGGSMLALAAISGTPLIARAASSEPVKLGLLHSLTGTIAIAEASLVDTEKLAIDEINAKGGILGRKIEPIVADGASNNARFAQKAKMLLEREKVAAIVGCYTSSSRKAVLPVLNRDKGLLYYPTYFEGEEDDSQVIYTSQGPTQSVTPSIEWLANEKGKKIYLVGSDYIYPRVCNKIAKATMKNLGCTLMGEDYIPLGNTEFSSIINKIKAAKPDAIYSTVVGGSNVAFYKQLKAAGIDGTSKPFLISTLVTEDQIDGIGRDNAKDFYSCMGYFQSIDNPVNKAFIKAFKDKYGQKRVIGDPMECAYNSVYFWKMGVEKAKSFKPDDVLAASPGLELSAPEGTVRIDKTRYVWKKIRIGKALPDGQFEIVWESKGLVKPVPYPKL